MQSLFDVMAITGRDDQLPERAAHGFKTRPSESILRLEIPGGYESLGVDADKYIEEIVNIDSLLLPVYLGRPYGFAG